MTLTFSRFKEIPRKTFQNFVLLFFSFTHVLIPEDIFQEIKFEMRDSFTFHSHDIDPLNMSRHNIILNGLRREKIFPTVWSKRRADQFFNARNVWLLFYCIDAQTVSKIFTGWRTRRQGSYLIPPGSASRHSERTSFRQINQLSTCLDKTPACACSI